MQMIPVEAHLFLNHVPVIGLVFGLVFMAIGISKASAQAMRAGLRTFVGVGVLGIPVGASGLVSAKVLASEPWLDANAVGTHQLAGIITVVFLVALAGLALVARFMLRNSSTPSRASMRAMSTLAVVGLIVALWTAYLGGGLRHSELRDRTSSTSSALSDVDDHAA